eukprot:358009-Chlamydomonas_euryale.AAC.9
MSIASDALQTTCAQPRVLDRMEHRVLRGLYAGAGARGIRICERTCVLSGEASASAQRVSGCVRAWCWKCTKKAA